MYIIKHVVEIVGQGRKNRFVLAEDIRVKPVEKTVATGRTVAGFREVTGTGENRKDIVRIAADGIAGNGTKRSWSNQVKRTSAELRQTLRRVQDEDVRILAQHDTVIAEIEESLKTARLARAEAAAEAWDRAEPVTPQDVTEKLS